MISLTCGTKKNQMNTKLIGTENRVVVAEGRGCGVGEMGERVQKIKTSSYRINKSWECIVQHGDYS